MKELQRRQQLKRALYSWPSLILLLVIAGFLVKGAFGIVRIERQNALRVKDLEGKAETLKREKEGLESEIESLKTEQGIIEEIKEKFSATREGEYMAIIVDSRTRATTSLDTKPWYERWWDAIMPANDK